MSKRISILVALEGADQGLKRAITSAERSLGELSSSAKTAGAKASAGIAEVKAGMSAFGEQVNRAKTQLLAFLSISWAAGKVQEIVQIADAWNMMSARLKLATAGQREYAIAQRALFDIAQRIGVPIQETAVLYGKLQQAVRMLGGEQQEALTLTESISQALRLSGASATEAQSSLLQFGQALASGVLRGEEFNSVVENSPRLAQALADGLNVPIGRLRKLAEEGRLTADVVVNALLSQKDTLAAEYAQLPATVSQAFTRLTNVFGQWISQVDESTGLTKNLAEALTWLSQNLDTVMQWLKRIAEVGLAVLIYRLIPAMITAWQTAGAAAVAAARATSAAWATANLSVTAAIASVGALKTAFVGLGAFLVGWEIGTWLSEKFEVVRKAGIFMVEMLVKGVELLRYRWEVFAAVFTSDTIAEATRRHEARLAQMNHIFAQMYADATKGSEAAKGAMNTTAATAEEIAKRLEAVRQGTQEAVARGVEAVRSALGALKSRIGEVEQSIGKATQTVNESTAKMAEAYKGLTSIVEANLTEQIEAVKARYEEEQTALERKTQSETALITKSTQLLTEALTQQSTLRQQATTETLGLIDQETQARKDAAARQGQTEEARRANVQRVENEILATKRQTLTQALSEYRQHVDSLNAEANRHLAEIQRIEDAKRLLSMTTEERIREIERQGMSEYQANEDRKRQIAEYQQGAREALANGELELARQLAQKAMDMAAQVASSQTNEAKRAEDARKQSEQNLTQVVQLEAQAREARSKQEYATADQLMRQAEALRAEIAQKTQAADQAARQSKNDVAEAIGAIRTSEELLTEALDKEAKAHRTAAQSALGARAEIQQTLTQTESQIDAVTAKLAQGLKLTLEADASRFNQAIEELDAALAEKAYLLEIQADLQAAEQKLQEYEQLLKAGKTLPVDADVTQAREALDRLKAYADQNAKVDLKVATEKAQAAITNVETMIRALGRIQTESRHQVSSNVGAVRSEIDSLNGRNTSSTHTIYVRRVEENAAGGVVGGGLGAGGLRHFASGGAVTPGFVPMQGGKVPGVGNQDTVPRLLQAGSFVLRKAAVRKYGPLIQAFAQGGPVTYRRMDNGQEAILSRAEQLGGLALRKQIEEQWARRMKRFSRLSTLGVKQMFAMMGDTVRALDELQMEQESRARGGERVPVLRFASGGALNTTDTVPAMLTPGEYVVKRSVVARLGVGFFEALNHLTLPAHQLAQRVQGFASGGLVGLAPSTVPRPELDSRTSPARTVRVELVAGDRKVAASIDARDESQLLQLLQAARTRAI